MLNVLPVVSLTLLRVTHCCVSTVVCLLNTDTQEFYEMLLNLIQTTWGEISWEEME